MRAFVLSAGMGSRFRPATDRLPKALLPFLNVPLVGRRLAALARQQVREAAVNLHHEGVQIVEYLSEGGDSGVAVRFFWEPEILGTAGALKNAEAFLEDEDFLVWNVDAEIDFDLAGLAALHRSRGAALTLLVAPNPDPGRFTPLSIGEGRLLSVGGDVPDPHLFTGISIVSPRALRRIPPGERSLVPDLWRPILSEGKEEIAVEVHSGSFFDLGTPSDFLAATLCALETRTNFEPSEGLFDRERRALCRAPLPPGAELVRGVAGRARFGPGARVRESVVWDGADLSDAGELDRCVVGPVVLPAGRRYADAFLWPGPGGEVRQFPLCGPLHGRHLGSPAVK
jgi:mannose-1-phosphate guanylyltransferase